MEQAMGYNWQNKNFFQTQVKNKMLENKATVHYNLWSMAKIAKKFHKHLLYAKSGMCTAKKSV